MKSLTTVLAAAFVLCLAGTALARPVDPATSGALTTGKVMHRGDVIVPSSSNLEYKRAVATLQSRSVASRPQAVASTSAGSTGDLGTLGIVLICVAGALTALGVGYAGTRIERRRALGSVRPV